MGEERARALINKDQLLEESLREAEKEVDKASKPSRLTQIALVLAVAFIFLVSILRGMSEAWAWEVAKALITINGLVLGFAVLGATSLTRRAVTKVAYKTMVEEAIDEYLERSPQSKESLKESLKKIRQRLVDRRLIPFVIKPAYRLGRIQGSFESAITLLLVSVGLSICLFGVSDTLVQNPLIKILFFAIYYLAIGFFILGTYSVMNVAFTLVGLSMKSQALDAFDTMWKMLEEKAKIIEEEEKNGKEKKEG